MVGKVLQQILPRREFCMQSFGGETPLNYHTCCIKFHSFQNGSRVIWPNGIIFHLHLDFLEIEGPISLTKPPPFGGPKKTRVCEVTIIYLTRYIFNGKKPRRTYHPYNGAYKPLRTWVDFSHPLLYGNVMGVDPCLFRNGHPQSWAPSRSL